MDVSQTMNIEVNIKDYLSDERIAEIAEEEVRNSFRRQLQDESDLEVVLSDLGYEFVYRLCKEEWDLDLSEELKKRMKSVLSDESNVRYEMFNDGKYGTPMGPAYKIVREECEKLRPLIVEEMEKHIREYPFYELDKDEISETILEVIEDKLFGDKNEQ